MFLFIWEAERDKEGSPLLFHSPNARNSQDQTRPKCGAQNSGRVPCLSDRNSITGAITPAPRACIVVGTGVLFDLTNIYFYLMWLNVLGYDIDFSAKTHFKNVFHFSLALEVDQLQMGPFSESVVKIGLLGWFQLVRQSLELEAHCGDTRQLRDKEAMWHGWGSGRQPAGVGPERRC